MPMPANPAATGSDDPDDVDVDMDPLHPASDGDVDGARVPATPSDGDAHHARDADDDHAHEDEEDDEDEADAQRNGSTPKHPYPHLRDIGHLASWTVSSHKQRCGVNELRSPSIHDFWQSDGPQPHMLTIHFFKRVTICHMRLHVDHDLDESYTPTRIQIWAGTAHHDLQLVTDMPLDAPKGWLDIDMATAGGPSEFVNGEEVDDQAVLDSLASEPSGITDQLVMRRRRRLMVGRGPTLRCFIVQVRILENHQNGKDTHLRGFQVFAKDHEASGRRRTAVPVRGAQHDEPSALAAGPQSRRERKRHTVKVAGIKEADWMGELHIR